MSHIQKTEPNKFKEADYVIMTTEQKNMIVHLSVSFVFKLMARLSPTKAEESIFKFLKDNYCINKVDVDTVINRHPFL